MCCKGPDTGCTEAFAVKIRHCISNRFFCCFSFIIAMVDTIPILLNFGGRRLRKILRWTNAEPSMDLSRFNMKTSMDLRKANTKPSMHFKRANTEAYLKENLKGLNVLYISTDSSSFKQTNLPCSCARICLFFQKVLRKYEAIRMAAFLLGLKLSFSQFF